ncbi:MAG: hypothetical protein L5655_00405 [Thermosediminibacteraceae bacterium]|nr:hypothetical protein [Thermosediminibacteraceae bacterium]
MKKTVGMLPKTGNIRRKIKYAGILIILKTIFSYERGEKRVGVTKWNRFFNILFIHICGWEFISHIPYNEKIKNEGGKCSG